jgi:hypothetical protein
MSIGTVLIRTRAIRTVAARTGRPRAATVRTFTTRRAAQERRTEADLVERMVRETRDLRLRALRRAPQHRNGLRTERDQAGCGAARDRAVRIAEVRHERSGPRIDFQIGGGCRFAVTGAVGLR